MAQKFVGVDLGNRRVKIAVVTTGLRGAQVLHVWEQDVHEGSNTPGSPNSPDHGAGDAEAKGNPLDAAIDTALRMLRERGLRHLPVGVALPGDAGSYRVLSFPFDDARQIAQAVGFELDGQFPVPIEQLVTDHLVIKRGDGRGRALVVAAKRAQVDHVRARFKLADVDLKLITTGALGVAQALASTPIAPLPPSPASSSAREMEPLCLVVDFGDKSTELVALASSGPVAARSMRRGGRQLRRELERAWGLDAAALEAVLQRDASTDDPQVRKALQPLLREIEHSRQWLKAEFGGQVVELRLSGGVARLRGLDRWLAQETGLDTALVCPKESGALRQVQGRDWTGALVALGTAVATGRRPLIQLGDSYESGGGEGLWIQHNFSTIAALGIAIVAFAGVDTMVRIKAAERERDAYALELERETLAMFGASLTTADAIRDKLGEVEVSDTQAQIPERGALEILEIISKSSAPKGGRAPPGGNQLPPGYTTGIGPDGAPTVIGPDGLPATTDPSGNPLTVPTTFGGPPSGEGEGETEGEPEPAVAVAPVTDSNAGILADDELVFAMVDIRSVKIDMELSATRATAQDRLAVKLKQYGCVREITKGMVRDRNDRKSFEMSIDHNCYVGSVGITEEPTVDPAQGASEDGDG
jgi:Tfp pilus assembly PilM family ATPase/citrate lyase gamma subunit